MGELNDEIQKLAPFSYEWFMILHRDMFGDVWEWAGKLRQVELSIGVKAYLVGMEIKKLVDDLEFWHQNRIFETIEIASRLLTIEQCIYIHF
jgi:fido (protein-threonine AMPylation protein)